MGIPTDAATRPASLRSRSANEGDTMTSDTTEVGTTTGPTRVETVIIGAGQTGLATAYHLGRAGRGCVVLHEHLRVGDQWRRRYDSLLLNTPAQYDSLPGMPFPAPRWTFPTGGEMADYLAAYADRFGLDVRGGSVVTSVERHGDGGFHVVAGTTTYHAENVVVATGGEHHPRIPSFARELDPGIRQLHSHDYHNPAQLLPGAVLVVGTGQSGADLALEVAAAGHETWLSGAVPGEIPVPFGSRRFRFMLPVLWFVWNHVLTTRTPIGRRAQPRIRMGGAPLVRVRTPDLDAAGVHRTLTRTDGAEDGRPRQADGEVLDVANVLWCTGFRQEFGFVQPLTLRKDGWPDDRGGVVPGVPGLYFVGLLFQRGFYSMLIGGAGRDAAHIAGHIDARMRARSKAPAGR
jgi:putative flavoprotein involved in K+ transport